MRTPSASLGTLPVPQSASTSTPEDCGGTPGYYRMVSIVEEGVDPWGEDAEETAEWLDGWDPGGRST